MEGIKFMVLFFFLSISLHAQTILVHIGGGLIHILLVIAAIVLIYNLVVGARSRRTVL